MNTELSANTQAILLLTAPLNFGKARAKVAPLTPDEYATLARALRELKRQPADLLASDNGDLLREVRPDVEPARLEQLLARGFLLSQALEHWRSRAIWIISRADPNYPLRLKQRLGAQAPAVLYGCGDAALLDSGGLAVLGAKKVDDVLVEYAEKIGGLCAAAQQTVICGGADGIDRGAMHGALAAGGQVASILADGLEKAALHRDYREPLIDGRLVLMSPFDPAARYRVDQALQRNKLSYALADAALVVSAAPRKDAAWTGAAEQLEQFKHVPVYVRGGNVSPGLAGLRNLGALDWPEPSDPQALHDLIAARPEASPAQSADQSPDQSAGQFQLPLSTRS